MPLEKSVLLPSWLHRSYQSFDLPAQRVLYHVSPMSHRDALAVTKSRCFWNRTAYASEFTPWFAW